LGPEGQLRSLGECRRWGTTGAWDGACQPLLLHQEQRDSQVVWITADGHYGQAIRYDPSKGSFGDFEPFWEFVAGPINAGTFGPNDLDRSFGPEVKFTAIPKDMKPNRPPSAGFQFFGQADIDAKSRVTTVALKDVARRTLFAQDLMPVSWASLWSSSEDVGRGVT
jgi:phosphodiesterase/alkaline phosphatase D-like protein